MREVEAMKRQMEYEAINGLITKDRLQEITMLWNLVFVGLLREGLTYQYIKNENNPKKDAIRLTIDNIDYNCLVSTLKIILKDHFYEVLKLEEPVEEDELQSLLHLLKDKDDNTKTQPDTTLSANKEETEKTETFTEPLDKTKTVSVDVAIIDEFPPAKKEEPTPDETKVKSEETSEDDLANTSKTEQDNIVIENDEIIVEETDVILENVETQDKVVKEQQKETEQTENKEFEKIAQTPTESEIFNDNANTLAEELISESPSVEIPFETDLRNAPITEAIEYNFKQEPIKSRNSFVYDKYKLNVFLPGAPTDNFIECVVAPLYMHENNLHPELVVMMKDGKNIQTFVSQKERPSITATFMDNEFIISGAFKNGEFQSYIYPSGITASKGCVINKDVEEFRSPIKKSANYGHNFILRDDTEIHIIPIEQDNDQNGSAKVIFCTVNDKARVAITNFGTTESILMLKNEKVQILSYWQDNLLSCDILH